MSMANNHFHLQYFDSIGEHDASNQHLSNKTNVMSETYFI